MPDKASTRDTGLPDSGLPDTGLPEPLPQGETVLWQGAPDLRTLLTRSFPLRWVALYFAVLLAWQLAEGLGNGAGAAALAFGALGTLGLALGTLGLMAVYAVLVARGSRYVITNRRVIMRVGVALPVTINLPFTAIAAADLRMRANGSGDLILSMLPGQRVSWLALWPHRHPWRVTRPEPMLRGLAQAAVPGQVLARALAAAAAMPVPAIEAAPARDPAPAGAPALA